MLHNSLQAGTVVFASLGCVVLPQLMLRRQQGSTSPLVLLTPPLFFFFFFFFFFFGRVGPPKGPHYENIRFFFFGGGEQSRETQGGSNKVHHWRKGRASAEANRCTHGNCIGRWSGSAVSAGSTVVNIASKWLERHGTCNGNGWDNYKHYQMYVH